MPDSDTTIEVARSQKEALDQGMMYYDTGKPCKHGHFSKRYAPNGSCYVCMRLQSSNWYKKNPGVKSEEDRKYRMVNRLKIVASKREYGRLHRESIYARRRKWLEKPGIKDRLRKYSRDHRTKKFGITPITRPEPAFCECCGDAPTTTGLHLDHCHESGQFRGWLCMRCNTAIGKLGDNLEGVLRAVRYLEFAIPLPPSHQ